MEDQDETYLSRNNNVIRWLGRTLPATVIVANEDVGTGTEQLALRYHEWTVELDFLNTEDDSFIWTGVNGSLRDGSVCCNTTHLLNSIKKHCEQRPTS